MLVYYFQHLNQPFEEAEPALLRMLPGLRGWAEDAYREGEQLRARVISSERRRTVAKSVVIEIGTPVRGATETWIPITWEATGAPGLFPSMEADIVVGRVGEELAQIALRGLYEVPLGPVGRAIDRVLLHRVAEASVKAFIDRIARSLCEPTEAGAKNADPAHAVQSR